ncbi:type II toxin-antitoxin system HicB family antitoxin [Hydrogenophaga sp.]|uniref:type II toxin-antitoxin system HicB family antitoxin n=1 Tax=Hydrogenophaga sp. TaxID=1904254 RepID=UPI002AB87557|nr:type II toxin-antitoxin system HicB family antitoxin [Hydrogenophaga sp.]MDZ4396288.1 type II toxin-antitoxin system HicB family antitoxin [Hydrogenophaga sp.]
MKNVMDINGYKALIAFDPETNLFRGEFIDLNGGADFYAADVQSLRREGEVSLKVFLDMCHEDGVEPKKSYSGKLMVRLPAELHQRAAMSAASHGKSLNAWLADVVEQASA